MCNQLQLVILVRPWIRNLGNLIRTRNTDGPGGVNIQLSNRPPDHEEVKKNGEKIKELVLRSPEVKKLFVELVRRLDLYYQQNKTQLRFSDTCKVLISCMMPTDSLTAATCSALAFPRYSLNRTSSSSSMLEGLSASGSGPSQSQPPADQPDEAEERFRIFAKIVSVMAEISNANPVNTGLMGTICCEHLQHYLGGMNLPEDTRRWEEAMQGTISLLIPWLKYMCYSVSTAEGISFIEVAYSSVKDLLMFPETAVSSTQQGHAEMVSEVLRLYGVLVSLYYSANELFEGEKRNGISAEFTRVQAVLLQKFYGIIKNEPGNQIEDCPAELPEGSDIGVCEQTCIMMNLLERLARENPMAIDLLVEGNNSVIEFIIVSLDTNLVERSACLKAKGKSEVFLMTNYYDIIDRCENGSLKKVVDKSLVDQIKSKMVQQIDKYNTEVWEEEGPMWGLSVDSSQPQECCVPFFSIRWITKRRPRKCRAAIEALKASQRSWMQPGLRLLLKERLEEQSHNQLNRNSRDERA